jgi:hypothetical protein
VPEPIIIRADRPGKGLGIIDDVNIMQGTAHKRICHKCCIVWGAESSADKLFVLKAE